MRTRAILIGVASLSLVGCGSEPGTQSDVSNVVALDAANAARVEDDRLIFPAHLISEEIRAKIDAYDDDRWFFQDDEDVDAERVIFVGDRQKGAAGPGGLIDANADNPFGFIRRALSYEIKGTDIIIDTEDASIVEAVKELEAHGSTEITSEYAKPAHIDTVFIDKSGLEIYRAGDDYIRFPSLYINIDPQVDTALSIGLFKVNSASARIAANVETEMVIDAHVSAELPEQAVRQVIYDESYGVDPLGLIPVSLNIRVELGCEKTGGPLEIEGGVHVNAFAEAQVGYARGKGTAWAGDGTMDPELIGKTFHVVEGGQATLRCVAKPDLRLMYFGMPVVSLALDGEIDLDMTTPPDALRAAYRFSGRATGLLSRIAPELGDQDHPFLDLEGSLWNGPLASGPSTPRPFDITALGDRVLRPQ